ncbi:MAG: CoA pyrophosphatase [Proteobacteria bacterium]|nr:CoA pyrophosphatase [Pseudomonadota bacterium]
MNKETYRNLLKNLPTVPGIQGKTKKVNAAVLVPFLMMDGEYHILFEERSAGIVQGGEVCFPGGLFDPKKDKNLKDTAVRETIEEIGIQGDKIQVDGILDTFSTYRELTVDPFVGLLHIDGLDELQPDPGEVQRLFTLPASYFAQNTPDEYGVRLEMSPSYTDENGEEIVLFPVKELGLPDRYSRPWGVVHDKVLVFQTPEAVVWGLTASILVELMEKIESPG